MSYRAGMALVASLALSTGCLGGDWLTNGDADGGIGPVDTEPGRGSDGSVDPAGDGSSGGGSVDPVADFNANVKPMLVGTDSKSGACGACHAIEGGVGPAFLLDKPDTLTTLLAYPGMIGSTPETSRLVTKGVHEGPGFTDEQKKLVSDWIVSYAANKPKPTTDGGVVKPTIAPFAPVMGANTIDVSVLDSKLAGATITFNAAMVGTSLQLTQLTLKTGATGVHIVHPLWASWDDQGNPTTDPIDSFSGLDLTVFAMSSSTIGPGSVLLPDFGTGKKLNVSFQLIESKTGGGGDGGVVTLDCKNLANFTANVKPLLQANCNTCHVGANPTAALSWDFNGLGDAAVCKNALGEIDTATPANSRLITKPNPGVNDGHPRKINNNFAAYQTAVTNWINLEK